VEPEELEELLLRTARLTEENNKILRAMQRAERLAAAMRIVRLVVVVVAIVALYFVLQPHLVEIQALIGGHRDALEADGANRNELIENFLREHNVLGEDPAPIQVEPEVPSPAPAGGGVTPQPR
jgi:hypothetical protein